MHWMTLLAQAEGEASEETPTPDAPGAGDKTGTALSDAAGGDLSGLWNLLLDYGLPLAGGIVILVAAFIVGKIISGIVRRASEKAKIDLTLSRFFGKLVYYLVLVVGVMIALGTVGIEVTSFAAILAAAGFAVGMALSGTLGNFAAGALLLIFRPFKVGDVVQVSGVTAKVNAIELFTTTLDTFDNRRMIIPNGKIYDDTIENISFHSERRMDVEVGCDYSADIQATRDALTKAAESLEEMNVKGEGRGFQVFLVGLGDSSVNWVVRFWAPADTCWPAKEALVQAVKRELDAAGIGIPFPQMDVHMDKVGE